jgi:hypothetical protein
MITSDPCQINSVDNILLVSFIGSELKLEQAIRLPVLINTYD